MLAYSFLPRFAFTVVLCAVPNLGKTSVKFVMARHCENAVLTCV